jgi:hypothetical protein
MVRQYIRDNDYGHTIIQVNLVVKEIYDYVIMGLGSNGYFCDWRTMLEWGQGYDFASSIGNLRSDSVGLLVYDSMRTIFGVSMLYYRSFRTAPTLLGKS